MIIYSKHLQTAKPNLLLIQPSIPQLFDELRMILLKSLQQILNEFWPRHLDVFKASVTIANTFVAAHVLSFCLPQSYPPKVLHNKKRPMNFTP